MPTGESAHRWPDERHEFAIGSTFLTASSRIAGS
jgi:hypothetical protein